MNNQVTEVQILEFQVVFPDETPLEPEEYLKGGSRDVILQVASLFLSINQYDEKSNFSNNKFLIERIFCTENKDFANKVYNKIIELERKGNIISILNKYSSLTLFELFFSKTKEPEIQTHAEFERNLFKAYLVLNSQFTQKQMLAFETTKNLESSLRVPMIMFCMDIPVAGIMQYNIQRIWATQMVRAIYLFGSTGFRVELGLNYREKTELQF